MHVEPQVIAAVISGGVVLIGFFVQGMYINRQLAARQARDAQKLAEIQGDISRRNLEESVRIQGEISRKNLEEITRFQGELSRKNLEELEMIKIQLIQRKESQDDRREALETLLNASSMAESSAKQLLDRSSSQSGGERVRRITDSFQKMSPFFEKASNSERNLHLIKEDVTQVQTMQAELVKMLLLLDLDSDDEEYLARLTTAFASFETVVQQFHSYVRSATAT